MSIHTIIGAGGAIGTPLAQELLKNGHNVRLLSRSGRSTEGAENRAVDVFDQAALTEALRGTTIAYLLVGLDYNTKIWQEKWPVVMQNTIRACAATGASLVFFDNVYMYGPVSGKMTEETPYQPSSKKGKVRAALANMLMDAVGRGEIKALIARSADFYGPWADEKSMFFQTVIKNQAAGKKAQWLGNPDMAHTMSYTLDCAKGLVLLANDPGAFNQIWHLPSKNPPLKPTELIQMSADTLGVANKGIQVLPKWMLRILGIFIPILGEMVEMVYQNEQVYWFDSSKFETRYGFTPTDYAKGLQETVEFYHLNKNA